MGLGYDGKLYILAFDHRGSFTKRFGIEGNPTPEGTERIAVGKHLIFEGLQAALGRGADPAVTGALVDEQFGGPSQVPEAAKAAGIKLAMPVEKSGQNEFDFEYGEDFGAHIEAFDPDFSKVLVRYNPDGDGEMNARQAERLARLAGWLHEHDRKFLFELLVPAEEGQLASVGGDTDRYDAELRPELMRRAIAEHEAAQVEQANATGRTPVVFIHGLWLLPSSWERWATRFEEAGYTALTPGWPDDPETVEDAKEHPEVFAGKTIKQVADHFEE